MSRPQSAQNSRSPSPLMMTTLATMGLTAMEVRARNVDVSQRDQDCMDLLISSSSADNILSDFTMRGVGKSKDQGRNVDEWAQGDHFRTKMHVPAGVQNAGLGSRRFMPQAHGDSRIETTKFTYTAGGVGALKKKLLAESEALFSVSLKKKARDIARLRAGQEGVSPKHALAYPNKYVGLGEQLASPGKQFRPGKQLMASPGKELSRSPSDFFKTDNYSGVAEVEDESLGEEERAASPSDFFRRPSGYGASAV